MRVVARGGIVVVGLACLLVLLWEFTGPPAGVMAGNVNMVGVIAALVIVVAAVAVRWRQAARQSAVSATGMAERLQAASDYLARQTLRYWRAQVNDRQIITPPPAAVCWGWASEDAAEKHREAAALTAEVVTQLREQLYDRLDGDRARVVVLGGPGAGKTSAMMLLLIDILEQRAVEPGDDPVPVWLSLGGWDPDTVSLLDWVAATVTRDYPGLAAVEHGGPATAAELLRAGRVALFLDGLDELPPELQGQALQVIDRDAAGLRVVLTSRPEEYRAAITQGQPSGTQGRLYRSRDRPYPTRDQLYRTEDRLYRTGDRVYRTEGRSHRAAVINLLPVGIDQAEQFLLAGQLGDRRIAWQHVTAQLRRLPGSVAARTLNTPLTLSLARSTYATGDPAHLLDASAHPTPDALLQHLLARSLTLAYPDPVEHDHATRWLSWIAKHLVTDTDLRWWDIPTWTPAWQRRLTIGLAVGLALALLLGPLLWLVFGLLFGLALGLMVGLVLRPRDAEPHVFTMRRPAPLELARPLAIWSGIGLVAILAVALAVGLVVWLSLWLSGGPEYGPLFVAVILLEVGLPLGLMGGLLFGLLRGLVQVWTTPLATARPAGLSETYRADRRRALTIVAAATIIPGLGHGLWFGTNAGLLAWLLGGLIGGLRFGGPALQLAVAELSWGLRFQRIRFMPLLETALERQVLRPAGALCQFRHTALRNHLAAYPITTPDS